MYMNPFGSKFETCDPNVVKHSPQVKIRLSAANGRILSEIIRQ